MKRWLVGLAVAWLLLLAPVATQGPALVLHFPFLIEILFELRGPIGHHASILTTKGPSNRTGIKLT